MKTVRFYHSAICPRCRVTSLLLGSLLPEYPEIQVERIEFLTHRAQARGEGVRMIPALIAENQRLSGFLIGKTALRTFLDAAAGRRVATPTKG